MWIPVSISRSGIRAAADSDCSDELCVNECVIINHQPINGQPGFVFGHQLLIGVLRGLRHTS